MSVKERAAQLLQEFKGDTYTFGINVLDVVGDYAHRFGDKVLVIGNQTHLQPVLSRVVDSFAKQSVNVLGGEVFPGARSNTPVGDVYRIAELIRKFKPDCLIAVGGGSTIDAVKAAAAVAALDCTVDDLFGTGLVSKALAEKSRKRCPIVAVPTVAGSGAHLTKYSNVTNPEIGQKKLIVDEALVPEFAVFDYAVTSSLPIDVTRDGMLDAISHVLEVFYGIPDNKYELCADITELTLELVLKNLSLVLQEPDNLEAREALGLAADLGGYAIMIGGTNGAHLTSFSLVDAASHGLACGILNPYYTVFFGPVIERQLRLVASIYAKHGYGTLGAEVDVLTGRELALAAAEAMVAFGKDMGSAVTLAELPDFRRDHIKRALRAAQDPQLEMKLQNMPIALTAAQVETYMRPILEAAYTGNFSLIRNMEG